MNEAAVSALQQWRIDNPDFKPVKLNPIDKSATNPKSLRLAINAKCWDCSNYQREEVSNCTAVSCPLHKVRPWQKDAVEDND